MADETDRRSAGAGLGLGDRLRSARKARALSLAQLADALHLEEDKVLALEEERFDDLGAPVFVRGHLRRYAQVVGLVPDMVLDAYEEAVPDSLAPPSLLRPRVESPTPRPTGWLLWLLAAVVIVGLYLAVDSIRKKPPAIAVVPATSPLPEAALPSASPATAVEVPEVAELPPVAGEDASPTADGAAPGPAEPAP